MHHSKFPCRYELFLKKDQILYSVFLFNNQSLGGKLVLISFLYCFHILRGMVSTYMLLMLQTGYLDIWEPATLAIKREAFTIKCSGPSGVVITEKFSPTTTVRFRI